MRDTIPSHKDFVDIIGGTAATGRNLWEKRWNQYYFRSCKRIVASLMADVETAGSTIMDVGTSHGNWLKALRSLGFEKVVGVELDEGRAELARQTGYDEVWNCDAANVPLPDHTIAAAVSNDVFVHILRREDKVAVLREMARLLVPKGVMVFNQTMSRAFGMTGYHVEKHCSFLTLDDLLGLCKEVPSLRIADLMPSYYSFPAPTPSRTVTVLRGAALMAPLGIGIRMRRDNARTRQLGLERADSVYVKLVKDSNQ
ncbi:MAG: class I SAM-dependent methyltransferase [Gemmatimonadetes bacterium]|jgi:ubiquinone/menaquinone biosynthesis C-methylase UbiE|nr:class I SAM-dependent methyltransferase [Gemmatimonadota bacterium]